MNPAIQRPMYTGSSKCGGFKLLSLHDLHRYTLLMSIRLEFRSDSFCILGSLAAPDAMRCSLDLVVRRLRDLKAPKATWTAKRIHTYTCACIHVYSIHVYIIHVHTYIICT